MTLSSDVGVIAGPHTSAVASALAVAGWRGSDLRLHVLDDTTTGAIIESARTLGAAVVVVVRKGRPRGAFWRPEAYALALARQTGCATLVVPEGDARPADRSTPSPRVLCATDFSPASTAAVMRAVEIAQRRSASLTLLHVLEYPANGEARSDERPALARMLRSVPPEAFGTCAVDAEVASGAPHGAILRRVTAIGADLVVMGAPDRFRRPQVMLGSTTGAVICRSTCPVLLVPAPDDETRIHEQTWHELSAEAVSAAVVAEFAEVRR